MVNIYFRYNNGAETVQIPVNPPQIDFVGASREYKSVRIDNLGEIQRIMQEKTPVQLSWSSYFPAVYESTVRSELFRTAREMVAAIERWRSSHLPVRLIITGAWEWNMPAVITDFSFQLKNLGDVWYTLQLKEYKFLHVRKAEQTQQADVLSVPIGASRVDERAKPEYYTVKSGDTLSQIALKTLGNAHRWKEIYSLNTGILKNPDIIFPGQKLRLPV